VLKTQLETGFVLARAAQESTKHQQLTGELESEQNERENRRAVEDCKIFKTWNK
jgi:hypothetical protein